MNHRPISIHELYKPQINIKELYKEPELAISIGSLYKPPSISELIAQKPSVLLPVQPITSITPVTPEAQEIPVELRPYLLSPPPPVTPREGVFDVIPPDPQLTAGWRALITVGRTLDLPGRILRQIVIGKPETGSFWGDLLTDPLLVAGLVKAGISIPANLAKRAAQKAAKEGALLQNIADNIIERGGIAERKALPPAISPLGRDISIHLPPEKMATMPEIRDVILANVPPEIRNLLSDNLMIPFMRGIQMGLDPRHAVEFAFQSTEKLRLRGMVRHALKERELFIKESDIFKLDETTRHALFSVLPQREMIKGYLRVPFSAIESLPAEIRRELRQAGKIFTPPITFKKEILTVKEAMKQIMEPDKPIALSPLEKISVRETITTPLQRLREAGVIGDKTAVELLKSEGTGAGRIFGSGGDQTAINKTIDSLKGLKSEVFTLMDTVLAKMGIGGRALRDMALTYQNLRGKQAAELITGFNSAREIIPTVLAKSKQYLLKTQEERDLALDLIEGRIRFDQVISPNVLKVFRGWDFVRTRAAQLGTEIEAPVREVTGLLRKRFNRFVPMENYFWHRIPSIEELRPGTAVGEEVIHDMTRRKLWEVKTRQDAIDLMDWFNEYRRTVGPDGTMVIPIGGKAEKFLQAFVNSGQAQNLAEADKILKDFIFRKSDARLGVLQFKREYNVPFYDRNVERVAALYATKAADNFAQIKTFGTRLSEEGKLFQDEFAKAAIDRIRQDGYNFELAQDIFDYLVGVPDKAKHWESQLIQKLQSFNTGTMLTLSTFTNFFGGITNLAIRGGPLQLLKAFNGIINSATREGYVRFADRAGILLEERYHQILREIGARPGGFGEFVLKKTGFVNADRILNILGANIGKQEALDLFAQLQKNPANISWRRRLSELGINSDKALQLGRLTEDDLFNAGRKVAAQTNFRVDTALNMPLFSRSPWGRLLFQFKFFAFNQLRFIKDQIFKEIGKRIAEGETLSALGLTARSGIGFYLGGEIINDIREGLKGKLAERPAALERFIENMLMPGFFGIASDLIQTLQYDRLLEFTIGPSASDIKRVGSIGHAIMMGNTEKAIKESIRMLPGGSAIAARLYPTERKTPLQKQLELLGIE